jgi:hypothetical protein
MAVVAVASSWSGFGLWWALLPRPWQEHVRPLSSWAPRPSGEPRRVAGDRGLDPALPLRRHPQQGPHGKSGDDHASRAHAPERLFFTSLLSCRCFFGSAGRLEPAVQVAGVERQPHRGAGWRCGCRRGAG